MNNKERVIDLRQFFIYVWQNFVLVVLIGALSAGGLAFLGYKKQKDNLSRITSIHTIMNQNRESYFNSMKNYTDAHRPENTVESRAKLYLDYNIDGFGLFKYSGEETIGEKQSDFGGENASAPVIAPVPEETQSAS